MQATQTQRTNIITCMQQIVANKMRLVHDDFVSAQQYEDTDFDADSTADYIDTATVVLQCYNTFVHSNNLQQLAKDVRSGLDTMVYEDVFDELESSDATLTAQLLYGLTA